MITTEIIAFATANELCVAFSSPPVSPGRNVSKSIGGAGTVEYMYSWIIVIFNHVVNYSSRTSSSKLKILEILKNSKK